MRTLLTLLLLTATGSNAELPRLIPVLEKDAWFDTSASALAVVEPFIFWSTDGLLCVFDPDVTAVDCHDTLPGTVHRRPRPRRVTLPLKSITLGAVTLAQDGSIANGNLKRVSKLRCSRSPLLDRQEYRYLPGPGGRLAILMLEEDDRRVSCARLDAQCPHARNTIAWRVLLSAAACPEAEGLAP